MGLGVERRTPSTWGTGVVGLSVWVPTGLDEEVRSIEAYNLASDLGGDWRWAIVSSLGSFHEQIGGAIKVEGGEK